MNQLNFSILCWVKFLIKDWIKLTKKGLLKRLKNIENAQKNLIRGDDNESIYYTPRLQFDSKDDEDEDDKITKQQYRHKTTNYL